MPRPPRVQFAGAIYHIVTRGDGRRVLFHDEGHYDRFTNGLAEEVRRSGWQVLAYCWMPNHMSMFCYELQNRIWRLVCSTGSAVTRTGMPNAIGEQGICTRDDTSHF